MTGTPAFFKTVVQEAVLFCLALAQAGEEQTRLHLPTSLPVHAPMERQGACTAHSETAAPGSALFTSSSIPCTSWMSATGMRY